MIELIDPSKRQHVLMNVEPRNTQFPYHIIGTKGNGFVPEAEFKAVVHELSNTKRELGLAKKEIARYELGKVKTKELPEESPPHLLWAEIYRLRHMVTGPEGFKTWKDAAVDERQRRVRLEQDLGKLRADKSEADKKRDLEIEKEARHIYNGWKDREGWIPWAEPGNSHMQERARDLARISVSTSNISKTKKHDQESTRYTP
jgi:hypothetical protein